MRSVLNNVSQSHPRLYRDRRRYVATCIGYSSHERHRRFASRGVLGVIWKHVRSSLWIGLTNTNGPMLVNIVSKVYTQRLAKERAEHPELN